MSEPQLPRLATEGEQDDALKRRRSAARRRKEIWADAIARFTVEHTRPLFQRIATLETEVAAGKVISTWLEKRLAIAEERQASFKFIGQWEAGLKAVPGNFVVFDGSTWACLKATTQQPGHGDAWQLCAKRGRDAR